MIKTATFTKAICLLAITAALCFVLSPELAQAQPCDPNNPTQAIRCGVDDAANQSGGGAANTLNDTIANIVNILSIIVGVAAVIMIIIGGLRYVTSNGDSTKVAGAKSTILYAIIGLIVAALAQIISRFVINTFN